MAGPRINRGRSYLGSLMLANGVLIFTNLGVPTDNVTGAGRAGPGSMCVDATNKNLYVNTNTKAAPTWNLVTRA